MKPPFRPSPHLPRLAILAASLLLVSEPLRLLGDERAPLREVCQLLCGDFSSAEQAKGNPEFHEIELHVREIWKHRSDGPWLYVEQAAVSTSEKPYRQRVYQLVPRADGRVESRVFTFENPLRLAGAWRAVDRFGELTPDDLKLREGCSVLLERAPDGTYKGETSGQGCASDLRGAAYATSSVTFSPEQFVSWDRGFDAAGQQVWGATSGGYTFRRTSPAKP